MALRLLSALLASALMLLVSFYSHPVAASHPLLVVVSHPAGAQPLSALRLSATIPGPLDGLPVRRPLSSRPIAVIVDNYTDAQPQAGLSRASMVIETLAEGGITRFMALYLEQDAPSVGPVRSTRVYFDRWASAFHAVLVHVGGNDDAQALLWHLPKIFNIDEVVWGPVPVDPCGSSAFCVSATRVPPYAMYTNTAAIRDFARSHHQNWAYAQASIPHKQPAPLDQRGRSGSLSISFADPLDPLTPNPAFGVRYDFNPTTDSYLRFQGGTPQVDAAAKRQLSAANVVVMETGPATADKAAGPTLESIDIPTIGRGTAWYFRDGTVAKGSWQQDNVAAPLQFLDQHGQEMTFNPGQTWVEVLPKGSTASWTFR